MKSSSGCLELKMDVPLFFWEALIKKQFTEGRLVSEGGPGDTRSGPGRGGGEGVVPRLVEPLEALPRVVQVVELNVGHLGLDDAPQAPEQVGALGRAGGTKGAESENELEGG